MELPAEKDELHSGAMSVDFPVCVVLPAGGTGERTGLQTPKQYCPILGRPLISYTVQAFERVSWVQCIVVVVAAESLSLMTDIVQNYRHSKVHVVPGGSTRHRSIRTGVLALGELGGQDGGHGPKVVLIHDAVRPFVDEDFLYKIVTAAKEHGAAGAIRPLVSTVIAASSDGFLDHSLERVKYRASEMPQGFTYKVISQAYQRAPPLDCHLNVVGEFEYSDDPGSYAVWGFMPLVGPPMADRSQCTDHDLDFGTECLHLALQYCGTNAKLIEGPPNLWKVTYRRDLAAAESIIKDSLSRSLCAVTGSCSLAVALARSLQNALEMYMGVDIVPDLLGDHCSHLQKTCNFILISVSHCSLSDVKSFLLALEAACSALLYPLVIFWVWSSGVHVTQPGAFRDLACLYKHKNILLYGIQLQHNKDPEIWGRSVLRLADIISALIRDRTSALVGQIFQA